MNEAVGRESRGAPEVDADKAAREFAESAQAEPTATGIDADGPDQTTSGREDESRQEAGSLITDKRTPGDTR